MYAKMPVCDWFGWVKGEGSALFWKHSCASHLSRSQTRSHVQIGHIFPMFSPCNLWLVVPSHSLLGVFKVRFRGSASPCVRAGACGQKSRPGWDPLGRGSAARIMAGSVAFATFCHNIHISRDGAACCQHCCRGQDGELAAAAWKGRF